MPVKLVEKHDAFVINKITDYKTGAVTSYQTLPVNYDGTDISKVKLHKTLMDARTFLGVSVAAKKPQPTLTKPKTAYAQCTKGYRADSVRSK